MQRAVDFASFLSTHCSLLIQHPDPLPAESLEKYRASASRRLADWLNLFEAERLRFASGRGHAGRWDPVLAATEEILVTEMLTRVWGGILAARDRFQKRVETEPLARHLMLGHLDARRRAFALLLNGPGLSLTELGRVDRLRRRVERWSDVLLGRLVCEYGVVDFACDPSRAEDFGSERLEERDTSLPHQPWKMMLMSLRLAFSDLPRVIEGPWEGILQQAVLGCFPPNAFSASGMPRSEWEERLRQDYETTPESAQFPYKKGNSRNSVKGKNPMGGKVRPNGNPFSSRRVPPRG